MTHFSFVIDGQNQTVYADGMTFLAPEGSTIHMPTEGSNLGRTRMDQPLNSTDNPFVAVELDIYTNSWGPPGEHVGIDINSTKSVANMSWFEYYCY